MAGRIRIFKSFLFILFVFPLFLFGQHKIIFCNSDTILAQQVLILPGLVFYTTKENPVTFQKISNAILQKVIYSTGHEQYFDQNPSKEIIENFHEPSLLLQTGKQTYSYKGIKMKSTHLKDLYYPLNDSILNNIYRHTLQSRRTMLFFSFASIPFCVTGYLFNFVSLLPTHLNLGNGPQNYGNKNLVVPGTILLGCGVLSGVLGTVTSRFYRKYLKKSAERHNQIILSQKRDN